MGKRSDSAMLKSLQNQTGNTRIAETPTIGQRVRIESLFGIRSV